MPLACLEFLRSVVRDECLIVTLDEVLANRDAILKSNDIQERCELDEVSDLVRNIMRIETGYSFNAGKTGEGTVDISA